MSTSERFRRIDELFRAVSDMSPDDRSAYLEKQCARDDGMREEVLSLLAEDEQSERSIIDQSILGDKLSIKNFLPGDRRALPEPPESIGRYRIVRVIGEGGMGVVYEAEQDNPRRTVALKVIYPGVTSASMLRRFEYETQILGRLQHPGIAQIFEAGTFDSGAGAQPYFAMEYVKGEPLTSYPSARNLTVEDRLEIIAKISEAVEHAHQRGVIHRDLKPGNILITDDGEPKILDFGVARATDSDMQQTTMLTNMGQIIGTIPYMSPEQAAGEPDELDTRSDVYALGVLAYELLAGRLPYEIREKMVHEAVRVIREQDPTPLTTIDKTLGGDIWTIIRTALEKDKSRRYQSAYAFAADIRRFLNDEPITARPPSAMYQIKRFARRNKPLVAGMVLAMIALMVGAMLASWKAVQATTARNEAETARDDADDLRELAEQRFGEAEAARMEAEAVIAFLTNMLGSANPGMSGSDVLVVEVLKGASERVGRDWADQPLIEARLRRTIGNTYLTLGQFDDADPHLDRALAIRATELGELDPLTLESKVDFLRLRRRQNRGEGMTELLEGVLKGRREVLGPDDPQTLGSALELAYVLIIEDRAEEAARLLEDARPKTTGLPRDRNYQAATNYLAMAYGKLGRTEEAQALFDEALAARRATYGNDHSHTAFYIENEAMWHAESGRHERAREQMEEVIRIRNAMQGPEHPATLRSKSGLADAYLHLDQTDRAESLLIEVLDATRRTAPNAHRRLTLALTASARYHIGRERYTEAEEELLEAHELCLTHEGADHERTLAIAQQLVTLYEAWGDAEKAWMWRSVIAAGAGDS